MKTHIQTIATVLLTAFTIPASAELVVIVNPQNSANAMTPEQVSQVFLGKSSSLTPVDQSASSAIRTEFYKKVTDKDATQVKALWSKLIFTGKGVPPKELGSSTDVKKAVATDPNAIGYVEKASVDASVKMVLTVP
jgi:ABC-type phosphate transport system substrate-binding protein